MDELIRVTPDREKTKSMAKMVEITLEMIKTINAERFSSNIVKEYYDVIRELMTAVLLLDGYKTQGEGAHKKLIEYMEKNCIQLTGREISLVDELRITRNRIAYDGFFVKEDYLARREAAILDIISKLRSLVKDRAG